MEQREGGTAQPLSNQELLREAALLMANGAAGQTAGAAVDYSRLEPIVCGSTDLLAVLEPFPSPKLYAAVVDRAWRYMRNVGQLLGEASLPEPDEVQDERAYRFRIVGPTSGERRLVDAAAALTGYAACDPRAETELEAYLCAFAFPEEFRRHLDKTGSTRGYTGPCGGPFIWWDIDREGDLEAAREDACRLVTVLMDRLDLEGDELLLIFFSGSKGFHVGLPTALWNPEPSALFNRIARRFAERLAEEAGAVVDSGVYDKVRAFRAPNSRHSKTGLYKRRLSYEELMHLKLDRMPELAQHPEPFDLPAPTFRSEQAAAYWREAEEWVRQQAGEQARRRVSAVDNPSLNRATLEFIRNGAEEGDRHRLLFSAAANLAEFGCPPALAHALLTEAALDSGLPPNEVHRQIECGLNYV
jgi:hypothetical protein